MLTGQQEKAVEILYNRITKREPVSVLQGYAGTGKSYLIEYLQRELGYNNTNSHFCAFTGTASKLLMDKGLSASTIHSLIYKAIFVNGDLVGFEKVRPEELWNIKAVFIDEYSMVPQDILEDLMDYGIPLVLIGDNFQLPAIGQPNAYMNVSHAVLTEVIRQALDNPVLWAATKVRNGEPLYNGLYGDILFVDRKVNSKPEWFRKDVTILTGTNKTRNEINLQISNSPFPEAGDKIIFLKNDWQNGITNGTIVYLTGIRRVFLRNYALDFITADGKRFRNYRADFQMQASPRHQFFDFAYAISVHKAQGQTIDTKGIIMDESKMFGEDRDRHLYTALTRFTGNHNLALLR